MNKLIKKLSPFIFLFLSSSIANAQTPFRSRSYFDSSQKVVICKEPLPEFTLNYDSNPSQSQTKKLCSCIWNKFPNPGHERETAIKIFNGEDPGWWVKAFIPKFNKAVKSCGGYDL